MGSLPLVQDDPAYFRQVQLFIFFVMPGHLDPLIMNGLENNLEK
jgi:hypothetical protein